MNHQHETIFNTHFTIVNECNDWMVINKPAGESVHVESAHQKISDSNQPILGVVAQLKQQLQLDFLAPVHRLDKVTSGCFLLAKNSTAAAQLSQQFAEHQVGKYYLAITKGKPIKKQGKIIGDMQPARRGNWKLSKTRHNPAITRFFSYGFDKGLRLALVKLETGKTHQIRVALKSNACPIWGDERYGGSNVEVSHSRSPVDRCYLHCWQMKFHFNRKLVKISCLPEQGDLFISSTFLEHKVFQQDPDELAW